MVVPVKIKKKKKIQSLRRFRGGFLRSIEDCIMWIIPFETQQLALSIARKTYLQCLIWTWEASHETMHVQPYKGVHLSSLAYTYLFGPALFLKAQFKNIWKIIIFRLKSSSLITLWKVTLFFDLLPVYFARFSKWSKKWRIPKPSHSVAQQGGAWVLSPSLNCLLKLFKMRLL